VRPPVSPVRGGPVGFALLSEAFLWLMALQSIHHFNGHLNSRTQDIFCHILGPKGSIRGLGVTISDIPTHTILPPPPCCPNTCASQMRGDHHPCPTVTLPPLGLSAPKYKVQRATQPPPDHESQMNPRIKDSPLLLLLPLVLPKPHALAQLAARLSSHILRC